MCIRDSLRTFPAPTHWNSPDCIHLVTVDTLTPASSAASCLDIYSFISKDTDVYKRQECEKESSHRQSAGDLGVRVQTGGMTSNPTARKAINNVITREALINCDFSGNVLDGVDQAEVYIRDAYKMCIRDSIYAPPNSELFRSVPL